MDLVVRLSREERHHHHLVEQNARVALAIADHGVVLNLGRVVASADAATLAADVASVTTTSGFSHSPESMPVVEFLQFTLSGVSLLDDLRRGGTVAGAHLAGHRLLNYAQGGMAMFTTYVAIEVITNRLLLGRVLGRAGGGICSARHASSPSSGRPSTSCRSTR